jgi:hypothetical protein
MKGSPMPQTRTSTGSTRPQPRRPRRKRSLLVVGGVVAAALALLLPTAAARVSGPSPSASAQAVAALQDQVQDASGAPRAGRDPANQPQTGLAAAASRATGVGRRTDTPAAAISGDHQRDAQPSDVLGNAKKTGLSAAGCFIDYGVAGQQCVPASAATNGVLTCAGVISLFPQGVTVAGRDRFHLDQNHDGTACGPGDR